MNSYAEMLGRMETRRAQIAKLRGLLARVTTLGESAAPAAALPTELPATEQVKAAVVATLAVGRVELLERYAGGERSEALIDALHEAVRVAKDRAKYEEGDTLIAVDAVRWAFEAAECDVREAVWSYTGHRLDVLRRRAHHAAKQALELHRLILEDPALVPCPTCGAGLRIDCKGSRAAPTGAYRYHRERFDLGKRSATERAKGHTWLTGGIDRSGAGAKYTHLIMAAGDPKRTDIRKQPEHLRDRGAKWRRDLKKTTVAEWVPRILAHLADGRARTFNAIGVEMLDKNAEGLHETPFERALWQLVDEARIEHTNDAPILFRLRRADSPAFVSPPLGVPGPGVIKADDDEDGEQAEEEHAPAPARRPETTAPLASARPRSRAAQAAIPIPALGRSEAVLHAAREAMAVGVPDPFLLRYLAGEGEGEDRERFLEELLRHMRLPATPRPTFGDYKVSALGNALLAVYADLFSRSRRAAELMKKPRGKKAARERDVEIEARKRHGLGMTREDAESSAKDVMEYVAAIRQTARFDADMAEFHRAREAAPAESPESRRELDLGDAADAARDDALASGH